MKIPPPHITFPDYKNFEGILTNTAVSSKEFIDPVNFFMPSTEKVGSFDEDAFIKSFFSTKKVQIPTFAILDTNIGGFDRFENFTKKDEVNHIALWMLGAFSYLSKSDLRIGKELEIDQQGNPRNGRLDDVAVRANAVIVIETKKDLKYLLGENRLEYQTRDYATECLRYMEKHLGFKDLTMLVGIGGEETDLFPPGHPDCTTGQIGDIAGIFYKKIIANNIKFVSANALWCLVAYQFLSRKELDLFDVLKKIFARPEVVGLLSGGLVLNNSNGVSVEKLDLETLG